MKLSVLLLLCLLIFALVYSPDSGTDEPYVFKRTIDVHIQNLENEDPNVRAIGAYVLADIGDYRAIDSLIDVLDDEDVLVRRMAARALGNIGDERAVEPLIRALANESNNESKKQIISSLGRNGDERAVDSLIVELKDENNETKRSAAGALGSIGDKMAVDHLILCLIDENEFVVGDSAAALGEIGDRRAVPSLIATLNNEDLGNFSRCNAASALGKIGDEQAIVLLTRALDSDSSSVRYSAASALGVFRNDDVVELLKEAQNDEVDSVRISASVSLAKNGDEEAFDYLYSILENNSSTRTSMIVVNLGEIGDKRAVEPLIILLGNTSNSHTKLHIVESLEKINDGNISDERILEPIILLLNDNDFDVRLEAANFLGKIGNDKAVDPLIKKLHVNYPDFDSDFSNTRYRISEHSGNEYVDEYMADWVEVEYNNWKIRNSSAYALGEIGDDRAVLPLIGVLNDEEYKVRSSASIALGKIGNETAVIPLTILLDDEMYLVRESAIEALGMIGDKRAVELLDEDVHQFESGIIKTIDNRTQVRIDPQYLGIGWREDSFVYMDEPVLYLIDMADMIASSSNTKASINASNELKADTSQLWRSHVDKGSIQLLRKEVNGTTDSFIEINTFVFEDINGSKQYFEYQDTGNLTGHIIEGMGDEAFMFFDKNLMQHGYIIRSSNKVTKMTVYVGDKEESQMTAEKIATKADINMTASSY